MFCKNSRKLQAKIIYNTQAFRKSTGGIKTVDQFSDEYQYIHKCTLPTFYFQKSLPRLPIPKVEATCERYLKALKPLLTETQYETTKNVVSRFKEQSKDLQQALLAKDAANLHTSYISAPWYDMYLKDRKPLVLNYNPGFSFIKTRHPDAETQLCKATNMTISSLRFMKSLQDNTLSPDIIHMNPQKTNTQRFYFLMKMLPARYACYGAYFFKAYPLDMTQYANLFSSTRIPQENKDILVTDNSGKHILVLRKGHFFLLDVLDEAGYILPPEDILACYKYILSLDLSIDENSIAVMTTENRDVWARARQHLISIHPDNFQAIKAIDSALFVVCLDDKVLNGTTELLKSFILGDGYNRWYDKSYSLIFEVDGLLALNFEHSWGDGVAVLRYVRETSIDLNKNPFVNTSSQPSNISPEKFIRKLEFNLDEKVIGDIRSAKENFNKLVESVAINSVLRDCAGRKFCKKQHISPDAFMQLAFQIAYHRAFGKFVSTYESANTSAFKHGRTETLRSCTEHTRACALAFNSRDRPSKGDLVRMIQQCSDTHKSLMKDALMGQGFDRHLFGLKNTALELGLPLPDLYEDEGYRVINNNIISTSTLSAEEIEMGGFGPVVPEGLGIGYTILEKFCGCVLTSFRDKTNGGDFATALTEIINEVTDVLTPK